MVSQLFDEIKSLTDREFEATVRVPPAEFVPDDAYRRFSRVLDVHPLAKEFPGCSDKDYAALVADIKAVGQKRPIALFEGMIWDGRERYWACRDLHILPKFRILRRKDEPIIYLIQRERANRYGGPNTDERRAALDVLQRIYRDEWARDAKARRSAWIARARAEFRDVVSVPQPCAVCNKHVDFVHAHHCLPLHLQFELGLECTDHTHDWLCPVHHKGVHRLISVYITATRPGDFLDRIPPWLQDEWLAVERVYSRGGALYQNYGGMLGNGWGHDFSGWER